VAQGKKEKDEAEEREKEEAEAKEKTQAQAVVKKQSEKKAEKKAKEANLKEKEAAKAVAGAKEKEEAEEDTTGEVDGHEDVEAEKRSKERAKTKEQADAKEKEKEQAEANTRAKAKAEAKAKEEAERTEQENTAANAPAVKREKSRRRRLSEAPKAVPDPTGVNVVIAQNTEAPVSTVSVTYGLPTLPFSNESTSSEFDVGLYAAVYHTSSGLLSQGDYVEFRPQVQSPPQTCVFYAAMHNPLDHHGSSAHAQLKALLCDATGIALKTHPALPRLTRLAQDRVAVNSSLWATCVHQQKKHLEVLRTQHLEAVSKWANAQKLKQAVMERQAATQDAKVAKQKADAESARQLAEHKQTLAELAQLKRQHETDAEELRVLKRARLEVCHQSPCAECPHLRFSQDPQTPVGTHTESDPMEDVQTTTTVSLCLSCSHSHTHTQHNATQHTQHNATTQHTHTHIPLVPSSSTSSEVLFLACSNHGWKAQT
jgi:hypothetical protein